MFPGVVMVVGKVLMDEVSRLLVGGGKRVWELDFPCPGWQRETVCGVGFPLLGWVWERCFEEVGPAG